AVPAVRKTNETLD
nr:RecName: Full=Bacteriocin rhamnosin A [Lacticaseibacillus rhamnosus]